MFLSDVSDLRKPGSCDIHGCVRRPIVKHDGGFVVTWTSQTSAGAGDGSGFGIIAQRYDAAGNTVGGEFVVNTETSSTQNGSKVSALSDGGFVIVWQSTASGTVGDGNGNGVFGQLYDNTGAEVGGEFQVNTETLSGQQDPVVAGLAGGGFVVARNSSPTGLPAAS